MSEIKESKVETYRRRVKIPPTKTQAQARALCTIGGALCPHFVAAGSRSRTSGQLTIICSCADRLDSRSIEILPSRALECAHRS